MTEQKAMSPEIIKTVADAGIIAVLVVDKVESAVPLAQALLKGGVNTIELTLRTPAAMEVAKVIQAEVPEMTVGLGTVLTVEQVEAAAKAEVDFAVAPGCNPRILKAARDHGLSFAPGIATPTDIEIAIENGCRILKYFPAATSGGMAHLNSMAAPYQYLGLQFVPLGGVNINNAEAYLRSDKICAIGGSWLAKSDQINAGNWDQITQNAQAITDLIKKIRS